MGRRLSQYPHNALAGLGYPSKALTGPWVHKYPHFAEPQPRIDFVDEAVRWWRRWLSGAETGAETLADHRLYLSEAVRPDGGRRHEAGRWIAPIAGTGSRRRLYLQAGGRLSPDPADSADIKVHSPLDCGLNGGEYFTRSVDMDLPGDQRADDAKSVCFDTAPLDQPIDVIGRPVICLPVAIDAPTGNLAIRLVDVHPDGTAHRVSLGVLNLAHRDGSETPLPMAPGRSELVRIHLDATGYRFLPGHRIRVAISTSYFPLILPPPTDITATIELGADAWMDLPYAEFETISLPPPDNDSALPDYAATSSSRKARHIECDDGCGRSTVVAESDTGTLTHPTHGMMWRESHQSRWSISQGDPLSMEGREQMTVWRRREGIDTESVVTGRITASASEWIVEASLTAKEDQEIMFTRDWVSRIKRDLM